MSLTTLHKIRHFVAEGRWKEIESFFNESAQLRQVGATIDLSDPRKPAVWVRKVAEIHRGGIGGEAVNGGVISMLIDLAIGLLGLPYFGEGMTATSHLSIHFVKPLMADQIILEAEFTEVIGNRIFGKVSVMNEKRELCTHASGALAKAIREKAS
jgi:acyl-coenzyme A thioesterase PaaI-like protein